jgi:hypothetical protein
MIRGVMECSLCGFVAVDREAMGSHLANEHPYSWEMAVSVVALQLMGPREL